jgi:4-hydroxy-3-methylbut-2-enyl diphosphate reductase
MRQSEARELAKESDLMVVVGSKKSANTTHLAEILKNCTKTIHIENDSELDKNIFIKAQNIGITAGASTPQIVIDKVINKIKKGK